MRILKTAQKPGIVAMLVSMPSPELRAFEDVIGSRKAKLG